MNLEWMHHAAVSASEDEHKWAIVCTDGDMSFAETDEEALQNLTETVHSTEFISGDGRHNYGLVRVDVGQEVDNGE